MELIDSLHLHDLIFLYEPAEVVAFDAPDLAAPAVDTRLSLTAATILTRLLHPSAGRPPLHSLLQLHVVAPPDSPHAAPPFPASNDLSAVFPATIRRLYLMCGLVPFHNLAAPDKKKMLWVGEKVVRDGIKWPTADVVWARKARDASVLLREGVERFGREGAEEQERDRADIGTSEQAERIVTRRD